MASTPEAKVKKQVTEIVRSFQEAAYRVIPTTRGMGKSGHADQLYSFFGWFLAVEVKAGSNGPTEMQKKRLREAAASGALVAFVNEKSLDHFKAWLIAIMSTHITSAPLWLFSGGVNAFIPEGFTLEETLPDIQLDGATDDE